MRILVTGSRDWNQGWRIERALINATKGPRRYEEHVLVSGACAQGADRLAECYAEDFGWQIEKHPADWKAFGRGAGPRRNAEMVALGADVCLAFLMDCTQPNCWKGSKPHGTHGTTDCIMRAEKAGIPVWRYTQ